MKINRKMIESKIEKLEQLTFQPLYIAKWYKRANSNLRFSVFLVLQFIIYSLTTRVACGLKKALTQYLKAALCSSHRLVSPSPARWFSQITKLTMITPYCLFELPFQSYLLNSPFQASLLKYVFKVTFQSYISKWHFEVTFWSYLLKLPFQATFDLLLSKLLYTSTVQSYRLKSPFKITF